MCRAGQLQSAHLDVVQRHNTFEQKQKRVREMESEKYRFKLARLEEDDSKYSKVSSQTLHD